MGQSVSRTDFEWVYTEEPHATRRKLILAEHPEIKELMGPDPRLKWIVLGMVAFQLASIVAIAQLNPPWWQLLLLSYVLGGTINHSMTLAIHEISHNLAFGHARPMANRALGIFANLPIGVPYSVSFKKYHLEHHRYQGDDKRDMDLPSRMEGMLFCNSFTKLIWLFLQPLFYSIRPLVLYPMPMTKLEAINIAVQLGFDVLVVYFLGFKPLVYMVVGTLLSLGIHPVAGHFISEHYMFKKGYETYSYYGLLNCITFNVGYHNEHHDFPSVAGSRLPKVRAIAPEWYDNLPCHRSWTRVLYDFITDPEIGPYSRVKRPAASELPAAAAAAVNGDIDIDEAVRLRYSPMLTPDYSLAKKNTVANGNGHVNNNVANGNGHANNNVANGSNGKKTE
ncbi:hypothetical protein BOX15_Mlig017531g1 [Macrostomum lignano]|uniref:sphingolipid 4-desaturase n=1 Tax=Macrostomum lignano TaxID=282301 RepID=A0A267H954_9PLAT|nr:hypothetical protein BOX15_Mlig017531g1 [Macrostomum lignano]